jgi:hypothetical protein
MRVTAHVALLSPIHQLTEWKIEFVWKQLKLRSRMGNQHVWIRMYAMHVHVGLEHFWRRKCVPICWMKMLPETCLPTDRKTDQETSMDTDTDNSKVK